MVSREREMTKDFFFYFFSFFVGSNYSLENESSQQGLESEIIPPTSQQQPQQLVQQQTSLTKPTALPSLAYDSSSDEFYQQPSSHQPFVNNADGCNPMQNSFQDSSSSISYDEYYHHQIHTSSSQSASSQSSDNLVMHPQQFYKEEDYSYCYYNNNYNYEYNPVSNQGEYNGYSSDIASATDTYNGYFCQHHATTATTQHAQSCDVTYAQY